MSISNTQPNKGASIEKPPLSPPSFGTSSIDTDLVILLDCSTSVQGVPFEKFKISAKNLINIMYRKSLPTRLNQIGGKSRIGIVSFTETAKKEQELTQNVDFLKTVIDSLKIAHGTNHYDGFLKASNLFDPFTTNQKVLVMFTDGYTSAGANPVMLTDMLKGNDTSIYIVGMEGSHGPVCEVIEKWADSPPIAYTDFTDDLEQIDALFEKIVNPKKSDYLHP